MPNHPNSQRLVIMDDITALSAAYANKADAASAVNFARDRQARRHVEHPQELYAPWFQAGGSPIGCSANGAIFARFVAPRDTSIYGITTNVTTASGNICFAVYDSSWVRLGTTGTMACPSVGIAALHLPALGVPLVAGRTYYLFLAADNTTFKVAGWAMTNNVLGSHMIGGVFGGAPGVFPAPASILTMAAGMTIGTPTAGPVLVPMLDPGLTAKPPTPLTMSINAGSGQVFCQDPATGRLFASTGFGLATSDDLGTTWTTTGFNTGSQVCGIVIAGSNLLIGTGTSGPPTVGTISKLALAGPYTNAAAVVVVAAQEGAVRPWNFVGYPDGVVFAGNYDSAGNGASVVRIRRSADNGLTWSVVLDLGASDNLTRHVHSIIRDPNNALIVWANIGDSGAGCGQYKSTDGGLTFARVAAFGSIRLTPAVPVSDGTLWLSDQYRMGGNLFWQDTAGTMLQPRSSLDAPWNGDGYAMSKDANGWIWYIGRYIGGYTRTVVLVSPDEGVTTYLVADRGASAGYATACLRIGNYLYVEGLRYDISALVLN